MCFIDFPMHASHAREQQKCILDIRKSAFQREIYAKVRFIGLFLKLRIYLIGMHHNGRAPCWRINLSHHFSVPPQIQRQSANAGMTAVIFPLSHCGGASSPRRCTVSEIRSRSAGANQPCIAHNTHTHKNGCTHPTYETEKDSQQCCLGGQLQAGGAIMHPEQLAQTWRPIGGG